MARKKVLPSTVPHGLDFSCRMDVVGNTLVLMPQWLPRVMCSWVCRGVICQGTFNFKESYMLFSVYQGPSVPYQFLENRNEQSCTQFSGLSLEMECICGFLSVTFYFSVKLLSRVPVSQDIDCLLAL